MTDAVADLMGVPGMTDPLSIIAIVCMLVLAIGPGLYLGYAILHEDAPLIGPAESGSERDERSIIDTEDH